MLSCPLIKTPLSYWLLFWMREYLKTRSNYTNWSFDMILFLFSIAKPNKLRATGDPIPDQEFFTLYRGVAGNGRKRRVNGISWTSSPKVAAWFAKRYDWLEDPAVFKITVPNNQVLACINDRNEKEYLLKLPLPGKPKRYVQFRFAFN